MLSIDRAPLSQATKQIICNQMIHCSVLIIEKKQSYSIIEKSVGRMMRVSKSINLYKRHLNTMMEVGVSQKIADAYVLNTMMEVGVSQKIADAYVLNTMMEVGASQKIADAYVKKI